MSCGDKSDYGKLRDKVWPFKDLWGNEVRDFLKDKWMGKVNTFTVIQDTEETTKTEAEQILKWWWKHEYGGEEEKKLDQYPEDFGIYLLRQYRQRFSVDHGDNKSHGRYQ